MNALADITTERIADMEQQAVADRELPHGVPELRALYRSALSRRATSGGQELCAIAPLWNRCDDGMPYYPSHYFEWLRMLPLRDVEAYAETAIKGQKYTHLVRPNLGDKILANKFTAGVLPTDILVRPPTEFANGIRAEHRELTIGARKLVLVLHGNPRGASAKNGIEIAMLRLAAGRTIEIGGGLAHLSNALECARAEVIYALREGAYDEAIDCLLGNLNDAVAAWTATHNFKMIAL